MSFFRSRKRLESEMDAELRFHLESFTNDLVKQGIPREEAFRRARIEFGAIEAHKEDCRESLGLRLFDELRADVRYALRMMKQSPGFTAVAVMSLGLGIGANTAIFTFAHEILLSNMGVPNADRLRVLSWTGGGMKKFAPHTWGILGPPGFASPFPYPFYLDLRAHNDVLNDLAAFKDIYQLAATVDGQAEPLDGVLVSGNFYQTLSPTLIAGRAIEPADDSQSATPVAIISDAYWAARFARSASVIGKTISLNRVPVTIVGVNSPDFKGPKAGGRPQIFLPLSLQPQLIPNARGSLLSLRDVSWLMLIGRIKPGVSDLAATTSLEAAFRNAIRTTLPGVKDNEIPNFSLGAGSRGLDLRKHFFSMPVYLLLALAGLVLLIACLNLANLLLARASARQREMSLRLAMGASHFRIVRQVFTEALLLALSGGSAGLLLGAWSRNLIPHLFDQSWHPSAIAPQIGSPVFLFALLITVVTGFVFGAAPAFLSARTDVNTGLKESSRSSAGGSKALAGKALVALQVSLSILLLTGAGLFLRTLVNLQSTAVGFNPTQLVLFNLNPPRSRYAGRKRVDLYHQIEDKLAALPGVRSATLSAVALLANSVDRDCFNPTGEHRQGDAGNPWTNSVGASFFTTMGIPIVAGRSFTSHDDPHSPKVAILSQKLAQDFFPGSNPIGRTVLSCDAGATPIEIIGVSGDAKYYNLRIPTPPILYLPYLQDDDAGAMTVEVKTAAGIPSVTAEIREAVRSIDKDLPLLEVRTQLQQIDATLTNERVFATLSSGFGLLALILASIGIYGIMSYTVSRRTNEIGIRMALGARSSSVLSMVLRETLLLALIGIAVGLAAAAALTRLAQSMLYQLEPTDPLTFAAAALLLTIIALASGFHPARRAAGVDPMHALRHE